MQQPKILVGCPTSEHKAYCLKEYVDAVKELSYPNYDVLVVDNSESDEYSEKIKQAGLPVVKSPRFETARETIVHSRNVLRKEVLEKGYDYFLSLEQDVIPPKDIIERLLSHGKKVVTGVYFTRYTDQGKPILRPLLWEGVKGGEKMQFVSEEKLRKEQVLQVKAAGLGCILIHRDVLEKIPFRLHDSKSTYDDMPFCKDLEEKDIPLFVATEVKCKHFIEGMKWEDIVE